MAALVGEGWWSDAHITSDGWKVLVNYFQASRAIFSFSSPKMQPQIVWCIGL